jgi:chaperone required for assembly of F1-ATPase
VARLNFVPPLLAGSAARHLCRVDGVKWKEEKWGEEKKKKRKREKKKWEE